MQHKLLSALFIAFTLPSLALAAEPQPDSIGGFLSTIVTEVPNPKNLRCNGVVDCRKQRQNIDTVYQLNQHASHNPRDYPGECYVPGDDGKYEYRQSACHR